MSVSLGVLIFTITFLAVFALVGVSYVCYHLWARLVLYVCERLLRMTYSKAVKIRDLVAPLGATATMVGIIIVAIAWGLQT